MVPLDKTCSQRCKPTIGHRRLGQSYGFVCPGGFANGLLLSGDQKYVDVWRNCLDLVASNARTIDGSLKYPHGFSDKGPGCETRAPCLRVETCARVWLVSLSHTEKTEMLTKNAAG